MKRTPLRGAPITAAEEVAAPIAASILSSNAWLQFQGPADFAREINSRLHI